MSFLAPKVKQAATPVVEPPPPPTVEDASVQAEAKADELRRRRGAASTVLTGSQGDTSAIKTASKALLGA